MQFNTPEGPTPLDNGRVVGKPIDRIDGPLKVSGTARYSYEYHDEAPNAAYGWVVCAGIATGRITRINTDAARREPGVLLVYTYENVPRMEPEEGGNQLFSQLSGPEVVHHGQAVAYVVAESFEQARSAALLIDIAYQPTEGRFDLAADVPRAVAPDAGGWQGSPDSSLGDFDSAYAAAPVTVDATYTTPDQHPAMMEPQASTAVWANNKLTLYTSTQMADNAAEAVAAMMDIPVDDVRVNAAYVGGGFGSKLRVYADAVLSAFAARELSRPVKTALAREQLLNHTIRRGATIQRVRLGAERDGRLTAIGHETWTSHFPGSSTYEAAGAQTRLMYAAPNRLVTHRITPLDLVPPSSMRAPSTATGQLAFEVAMDELAVALRMDPVELRIINDSQTHPEDGRPFSSRQLVECLREGANRFGWQGPAPMNRRDGDWLIGTGMASAMHHHGLSEAAVRVRLDAQGRLTIETSMTDIGTGTYTALAQIAGEMTGIPLNRIDVRLGDTLYPAGSGSIASIGLSSTGAAVFYACRTLCETLATRAGVDPATAHFEDGMLRRSGAPVELGELAGADGVSADGAVEPGELEERYAQAAFGAHFCEVGVNADTGETRIRRMLGVFAAGRIINEKMARSQAIGGMVFGIGAALTEDAVVDTRFGYFVNHDIAEYHIPVHADVPAIDAVYLPERDDVAAPIKTKGVGELGICGSGAAIANAMYNATGIRLRDYPMTLDKIITQLDRRRW